MGTGNIEKYFKYAIGEILLVMIGILLALQVNNWNQNRLNKKESKSIIASIHDDLVKDTLLLSERISGYEELYEYNLQLTNKFDDENISLETFKNLAKDFNPTFSNIETFNNTTMSSIESTGKIELLNNNLKKELLEYKNRQSQSLNATNSEIYLSFVYNFTSKYSFGKNKGEYINQLNSKIYNEQEYVNTLTNLISYKNYMMNSSLNFWKVTKEKATKILLMINDITND